MIRVHVICEGQTEEEFVRQVLCPALLERNVILLPSCIGKVGHKGGNVKFQRLLLDIRQRLLGDQHCYCTTLMDYYGLPSDFPGKEASDRCTGSYEKLSNISEALSREISLELGAAGCRFIPYVQMYEFEGLLFSQTRVLAESIQKSNLAEKFGKIRDSFSTPEDINDSPDTAPSKRIERLFSGYDKPIHPVLAASEIGLDAIRLECRLFDRWVKQIEELTTGNAT